MNDRRNFLTACLSGAAWLMGWKGEKPKEPKAVAWLVEPDIQKEVPVLMHQTLSDGGEKYWTEFRVLSVNEWRSKPCES